MILLALKILAVWLLLSMLAASLWGLFRGAQKKAEQLRQLHRYEMAQCRAGIRVIVGTARRI